MPPPASPLREPLLPAADGAGEAPLAGAPSELDRLQEALSAEAEKRAAEAKAARRRELKGLGLNALSTARARAGDCAGRGWLCWGLPRLGAPWALLEPACRCGACLAAQGDVPSPATQPPPTLPRAAAPLRAGVWHRHEPVRQDQRHPGHRRVRDRAHPQPHPVRAAARGCDALRAGRAPRACSPAHTRAAVEAGQPGERAGAAPTSPKPAGCLPPARSWRITRSTRSGTASE